MKTTKIIICLVFLAFFIPKMTAQRANVASGGNATGSGGSVSYAVGQVAYTTATGAGGTSSQGVQQAYQISTLSTDDFPEIVLQMLVYPNPTTSFVNLTIANKEVENLNFQLSDMTGKQIQFQKIQNTETQVEMENLPQGVYFLNVIENNKSLKTFKIIKN